MRIALYAVVVTALTLTASAIPAVAAKIEGVPAEEPKGALCYAIYVVAADKVAKGQLNATEFPGIVDKREKAKVAVTKQLAAEGMDAEWIANYLESEVMGYETDFGDGDGGLGVAPGYVDSRVRYCDKQF